MGRTHILSFLSSEVVGYVLKEMNAWDICWQVNELVLQKKKNHYQWISQHVGNLTRISYLERWSEHGLDCHQIHVHEGQKENHENMCQALHKGLKEIHKSFEG
jgi:hypothetical protein